MMEDLGIIGRHETCRKYEVHGPDTRINILIELSVNIIVIQLTNNTFYHNTGGGLNERYVINTLWTNKYLNIMLN